MRLLISLGTRPEALKLAPLILAAGQDPFFETIVCTTGQHREIVEQANQSFGITPDQIWISCSQGRLCMN